MGKGLHQQQQQHRHHGSNSSTDSAHSSGKMKGILQHFHHNPWNKVKKKLPYKKHGSGKHSIDKEGNKPTTPESPEVQNNSDSAIDNSKINGEITKKTSQNHAKNSMKSRLKALITDEMKRKGRHRSTSSCPENEEVDGQLSIHHHAELTDTESPAEANKSDEVLKSSRRVHPIALGDPDHPNIVEDPCKMCSPKTNMNYLKQSEVEQIMQEPVRDHTLLRDKLIYAIEPSKDASHQESKLFMDALDLLNMRKEVFLRVVHDQSSSLAQQLQSRQKSNMKPGFTKSVSFPMPGSSARDSHENENSTNKENRSFNDKEDGIRHSSAEDNMQLVISKDAYMENGGSPQSSKEHKPAENASSSPSIMLRKMHSNKAALHQFKKLRAKLKVVIRGKKEGKEHLVKDAVHHKVPYGQKVPKEKYCDTPMPPESKIDKFSKYRTDSPKFCQGSEIGKLKSFKRTASFNESMDRYNRLLETTSREALERAYRKDSITSKADNTSSSDPKRRPVLGRVLSLPQLRHSTSMRMEDSTPNKSFQTPETIVVEDPNDGCNDLTDDQQPMCSGSENKLQPSVFSESENQQDLLDISKMAYDWYNSKAWESSSSSACLEPALSSPSQPLEENQVSQDEYCQKGEICPDGLIVPVSKSTKTDSSPTNQENAADMSSQESKVKQYYDDLSQLHVDAKNEAEFNYVKDVLELSGFSGDEILGKWHSAENPVDPTVFDEVEGCLVEWSAYKEGETSEHLLLFDLINQILLGIYERSCSYWPKPLTGQSDIHRMPKGQRVLEEVWAEISLLLSFRPDMDQAIDDLISQDFTKRDKWMSLQFDAECAGLEVEDLIFDDLLEEIISDLFHFSLVDFF